MKLRNFFPLYPWIVAFVLVLAFQCAGAQVKKPEHKRADPANTPVPDGQVPAPSNAGPKVTGKETSQDAQIKILKAREALSKAKSELDALSIQWANNKQRYDQVQGEIQGKVAPVQQDIAMKQTLLKTQEDAACKAVGLEPEKYSFDEEAMTCSPKADPAPVTPSPEKK